MSTWLVCWYALGWTAVFLKGGYEEEGEPQPLWLLLAILAGGYFTFCFWVGYACEARKSRRQNGAATLEMRLAALTAERDSLRRELGRLGGCGGPKT